MNFERKPCPLGRGQAVGPADQPAARISPPGVVHGGTPSAKVKPGEPGPLPADMDTRWSYSRGVKITGLNRPPSSQNPYPSLEPVGNDRVHEGVTAHQNLPRSRLSTRPRPVAVESGRWHGPCRSRRNAGSEHVRSDGRSCCGRWRATGRVWSHKRGSPYRNRTGVVTRPPPRRGAHEPGTPSGEKVTGGVASDGPTWFGRPPVSRHHETAKPFRTTPRGNPRSSGRGGCQNRVSRWERPVFIGGSRRRRYERQ